MQVIVVKNPEQGLERAKEEVYKRVDAKTVLFLSGGNTPKPLYETLAKEGIVKPAAAALVDERFGEKMHKTSNERMLGETGLLKYFTTLNTPFYPILQDGLSREETSEKYDEKARDLFFHFPKSVGVMGIGADGHTSSIIPNRKDFINPMFEKTNQHKFVGEFDDENSNYKQRVGLTFAGLALLDFFIVLVFGKDKAKALKKTFDQGPLEEIPARFYLSDTNAKKALFITDQKV